MMNFRDAVAIVTGSGSGIGRAVAIELSRQGMAVVVTARRAHLIDETVSLITSAGGRAIAVTCDITDPSQVQSLVVRAIAAFGRIDVLVNNAASFNALGGLWEVDPADWWKDVTVNLLGPMQLSHAVLPHMIRQDAGVIININGGGATQPLAGGSAYGCSKAALLRLTDTLGRELERIGSHVMVVALGPGFVRTEMTERQAKSGMGLKWIPGSKDALDAGHDRPPEDCARSTVELLKHLRPEFNGRIFNTGEDFAALAEQAADIAAKDLRVLRGR